ncbi:MAG: ABC transporter permease, partial [Trebonia sp.]
LRVGVVASISLASLGQLIGVSSLGYLFIDGLQRSFPTEIYVGLVCVIVLAVICDLLLVGVRRVLTPWQSRRQVALAQWPGLQRVALRRGAA